MTAAPRRYRIFRQAWRAILVCLLVAAGLTGGAVLRLMQGPIVLPERAVAWAETRATAALSGPVLSLGEVAIALDRDAGALRLAVADAVLSRDGAPLIALPGARVSFDGEALLRGRVRPLALDIEGLALDVSRDAEGRLSLALVAGGTPPRTAAEALARLDAALALPAVAELDTIRVGGIDLRLRDAVTGLEQDLTDGTLTVERTGAGARLALAIRVPTGPGRAADLSLSVERGAKATARVALRDMPLGWLAETLPGIPALRLVSGRAELEAAASLSDAGVLGDVTGRAVLRDARLVDRPSLMLDRAALGLGWTPGTGRIALTEIAAGSDLLAVRGTGQILLEDGLTGPVQVQLRLGETRLDPEGALERPVAFDQGVIAARLTQAPLALRIGQAMVTGPSGTARAAGRLAFPPGGIEGAVRLSVPEMGVRDLAALWPPDFRPGARGWFTSNLLEGRVRDATALLRLSPGMPPEVEASFSVEDGRVRFMRQMPPAEGASGAAQFDGRRFSLRIDAAQVPARGPEEAITPETPRLPLSGFTLVIPDATAKPARAEIAFDARGPIPEIMTLLDNEPLRLMRRIGRGPLGDGLAETRVSVALPLRPGNAPADIAWSVAATLRDVRSDTIVPGRPITAETLTLTADASVLEVAGAARLDGVPFEGLFRQPLPPPGTEPIRPDAPPAPPVPRPPGSVTGTARVTPDDLARLGIAVDALDLSGSTSAQIELTLAPGARPRLEVRSTTEGMRVGLPALSWSKPASRAATLAVDALLGGTPEVERLSLDAPGLSAEGRITLAEGGGLARATFTSVDAGWFRGPVTLVGRGRGAAPAIEVRGGRADLRRASLGGGGGGGSGGGPISLALDRLTITEGIALTDLRATLQNGSGRFSGRINGGTEVAGALAPQDGRTAVQVDGADAGGVLRAAGLFQDARGGSLRLVLRPAEGEGVYSGALRIRQMRIRDAPALASLLQALSVVGILDQLGGEGLFFETVESDFILRPGDILVRRASAVGPSMSITADGVFDTRARRMDMQGVISPIYIVNGLFGALFGQRDEGLFGFTYTLRGPADAPQVGVNPLSILTPGAFRDIFRSDPPGG